MKLSPTIHVSVCYCLVLCNASAQSAFHLANYDPPLVNAPIFDAQGVPLVGTNYLAELWGAATPDSLTPLLVLGQGERREIVQFSQVRPGYFISTLDAYLVVPTVSPRGFAWLQVRAWDARLGPTYEAVAALGIGGYGESPLFYARGSDPFLALPEPPAPLIGLQSFSLLPIIPEPSSWALLAMGGGALWALVRRRRS